MERVDDDTAAEMIAQTARQFPGETNRRVYERVRERWNVAVSHRQVATMMQVMRREYVRDQQAYVMAEAMCEKLDQMLDDANWPAGDRAAMARLVIREMGC